MFVWATSGCMPPPLTISTSANRQLRIVGTPLIAAGAALLFVGESVSSYGGFLGGLIGIPFALLGKLLMRQGRKLIVTDAHKVLMSGDSPILYLRSFSVDYRGDPRLSGPSETIRELSGLAPRSLEWRLKGPLTTIAPVVAIYRKSDDWMSSYFAPLFVDESTDTIEPPWKEAVKELLQRSRLVLISLAGASQGLLWELEELVRLADPCRVVMILPTISKRTWKPIAAVDEMRELSRTWPPQFRTLIDAMFAETTVSAPTRLLATGSLGKRLEKARESPWPLFTYFDADWSPRFVYHQHGSRSYWETGSINAITGALVRTLQAMGFPMRKYVILRHLKCAGLGMICILLFVYVQRC